MHNQVVLKLMGVSTAVDARGDPVSCCLEHTNSRAHKEIAKLSSVTNMNLHYSYFKSQKAQKIDNEVDTGHKLPKYT